MSQSPKLFTCPKCRHTYLGHDPLPDCPGCGYDYREKEGFRWDLVVYLLSILALLSFLLVASHYRGNLGAGSAGERPRPVSTQQEPQRPFEADRRSRMPFQNPYHESGG